jgi:hypothetical protein
MPKKINHLKIILQLYIYIYIYIYNTTVEEINVLIDGDRSLLGKLSSPRKMGLYSNPGPVDLAGPT